MLAGVGGVGSGAGAGEEGLGLGDGLNVDEDIPGKLSSCPGCSVV